MRVKYKCMYKDKETEAGDHTIILHPVIKKRSEENKDFFQNAPGGQITLAVVNPAASEQFEIGKCYYVDFTPAD